jgi:hypothetical protein
MQVSSQAQNLEEVMCFSRFTRLHLATLLVLLAGIFFTPTALKAQGDSSSMTGEVTDATGAVVPGATVNLSNKLTGVSYTQTTDKQGFYRFANVPPGTGYTVVVSHAGFSSVKADSVSLAVGLTRTQDAKLVAGSAVEVNVSEASQAVTLDTTDATIGNNIDVQELNDLPVLDRTSGITTLFTLQPGVDFQSGAVTGARTDQSEVTLDGMDEDDLSTGQALLVNSPAPIDAVDQFTGTVAGLGSGIGTGSGGQFQLVTKSGTNKFHGNINEYHRDTTTEANDWFNNLVGIGRTPLIRNQFGGNIGGPIVRDKLFFFFNFGDSRIIESASTEDTVPLPNLQSATPTLNYINNGPGCNQTSRLNTTPTCISTLTATQVAGLDPAGIGFDTSLLAFINGRYPASNDPAFGDGVNTGGLRFTVPDDTFDTNYVARIDYNLTPSQKVFGRFNIDRTNGLSAFPAFPTDPITHPFIGRTYSYVVSDIWTIGKNKVNQFYYGDTITKDDFPDVFNPTGVNQFSGTGTFSGLSAPYTSFDGQDRRVPIPTVRDDFNWQRGDHSWTMGGTFKFIKTNSNLISNFNQVGVGLEGANLGAGRASNARPANIGNDSAGVAVTDYDNLFATTLGVIGDIASGYTFNNAGVANPEGTGGPRAYRYFETEMYVGDTWRITKKLTMSYGLRYQLYSVPYEVHGDESVSFDTNTNGPISLNRFIAARQDANGGNPSTTPLPLYSFRLGGKANNGPNLYNPSYKDFAPRVAFAYSLTPKTVLNASAGIVYDRTVINAVNFLQDQLSYLFTNTSIAEFGVPGNQDASLAADPRIGANLSYPSTLNPAPLPIAVPFTPFVTNGVPDGLGQGQANFIVNQNLRDPYSVALNAGVQQQLPFHMVAKVNYVGRFGRRLLANADGNQVIDVPDYTGLSTQSMVTAFAALTTQLRACQAAGTATCTLTPQPWFEDVLGAGLGIANNAPNNTTLVSQTIGTNGTQGSIANAVFDLASAGFMPTNVGMPSQFDTSLYLTNKGSSNYNGLLLTLSKNMSQGLRFDFNYTWAHSIDNTSLIANNNPLTMNNPSGVICDILQPRACRGNSDFDIKQEISSDFTYDLPVGHGKEFLSATPHWVDEMIGGWALSGLPSYRTGIAVTAQSDAFLASAENDDPAIFTGNKADVKVHINTDHTTNTVYAFAGGAAGALKAFNDFVGPVGLQYGQRNLFRGPGAFYFEAGLAKTFPIIPSRNINLNFRADAFNVFNHPVFASQAMGIVNNASNFGQITGTNAGTVQTGGGVDDARVAQFSLRLEF